MRFLVWPSLHTSFLEREKWGRKREKKEDRKREKGLQEGSERDCVWKREMEKEKVREKICERERERESKESMCGERNRDWQGERAGLCVIEGGERVKERERIGEKVKF